MPTVIFRADAGLAIGSGHVMRDLALAEKFLAEGWRIGFAVNAEAVQSVGALSQSNFEIHVLPGSPKDEPAALQSNWPRGIDLFVVDHYERAVDFEKACRPWARQILVVDDLANRAHDADMLLDSVNPAEAYVSLVSPHCRLLCGPQFAIIHERFRLARGAAVVRRDGREVGRVLVSFGQIDAPNMNTYALRALRMVGFKGRIDVAIGSAAPHFDEVRAAAQGWAHLHADAPNLDALMSVADVAIGSGGVTAWERCCLGLPSILNVIAENQRRQVAIVGAAGAGLIVCDPHPHVDQDIAKALNQLVKDQSLRLSMAHAAAALVDGSGPERIVGVLRSETARHD